MTRIRSATHPGLLVPVSNFSLQSVRWARCRMLQMEDTGPRCWLIILLSLSCFCLLLRWELSTHEPKHWQRLEEEVNGTRGMKYYPVLCLRDYTQKWGRVIYSTVEGETWYHCNTGTFLVWAKTTQWWFKLQILYFLLAYIFVRASYVNYKHTYFIREYRQCNITQKNAIIFLDLQYTSMRQKNPTMVNHPTVICQCVIHLIRSSQARSSIIAWFQKMILEKPHIPLLVYSFSLQINLRNILLSRQIFCVTIFTFKQSHI